MIKSIILATFLAILFFPASILAYTPVESVPGEIIVKFKPGKSPEELQALINQKAGESNNPWGRLRVSFERMTGTKTAEDELEDIEKAKEKSGFDSMEKIFESDDPDLRDIYLIKTNRIRSQEQLDNLFSSLSEVSYAQPNYMVTTESDGVFKVPDDPKFSEQWNLVKIGAPNAWLQTQGSSNVIVAIIDTGIDYNHEDLPKDIIKGPNFADGNDDPLDDEGHGTEMAGIISAITGNNRGVSGVASGVRLMAIRVLRKGSAGKGIGSVKLTVKGIEYAINHQANIINLSLGGPRKCIDSPLEKDIIGYAAKKGVLVIAAAGNLDTDAAGLSPASCPGVIAVGATNIDDKRNMESNFGSMIKIAAPGGDQPNGLNRYYITTTPHNSYGYTGKSSGAAAHVSAAAALLLSKYPTLNRDQIEKILVDSGDPISTDKPVGGKRLNVAKALLMAGGLDSASRDQYDAVVRVCRLLGASSDDMGLIDKACVDKVVGECLKNKYPDNSIPDCIANSKPKPPELDKNNIALSGTIINKNGLVVNLFPGQLFFNPPFSDQLFIVMPDYTYQPVDLSTPIKNDGSGLKYNQHNIITEGVVYGNFKATNVPPKRLLLRNGKYFYVSSDQSILEVAAHPAWVPSLSTASNQTFSYFLVNGKQDLEIIDDKPVNISLEAIITHEQDLFSVCQKIPIQVILTDVSSGEKKEVRTMTSSCRTAKVQLAKSGNYRFSFEPQVSTGDIQPAEATVIYRNQKLEETDTTIEIKTDVDPQVLKLTPNKILSWTKIKKLPNTKNVAGISVGNEGGKYYLQDSSNQEKSNISVKVCTTPKNDKGNTTVIPFAYFSARLVDQSGQSEMLISDDIVPNCQFSDVDLGERLAIGDMAYLQLTGSFLRDDGSAYEDSSADAKIYKADSGLTNNSLAKNDDISESPFISITTVPAEPSSFDTQITLVATTNKAAGNPLFLFPDSESADSFGSDESIDGCRDGVGDCKYQLTVNNPGHNFKVKFCLEGNNCNETEILEEVFGEDETTATEGTGNALKKITKLVVNGEDVDLTDPSLNLENLSRDLVLSDDQLIDGKYKITLEVCFNDSSDDCLKTAYSFTVNLPTEDLPAEESIPIETPSSIIEPEEISTPEYTACYSGMVESGGDEASADQGCIDSHKNEDDSPASSGCDKFDPGPFGDGCKPVEVQND